MKKLILAGLMALMALFVSFPVQALDQCYTGSWVNRDLKHEGLSLEVLDGGSRVLVYWYGWRFFDKLEQNWVLFVGPEQKMDAYDILPYTDENGDWGSIEYIVGSGTVTPVNDNQIVFEWDYVLELDQVGNEDVVTPWCLDGGCQETGLYTRLTQPVPCTE